MCCDFHLFSLKNLTTNKADTCIGKLYIHLYSQRVGNSCYGPKQKVSNPIKCLYSLNVFQEARATSAQEANEIIMSHLISICEQQQNAHTHNSDTEVGGGGDSTNASPTQVLSRLTNHDLFLQYNCVKSFGQNVPK